MSTEIGIPLTRPLARPTSPHRGEVRRRSTLHLSPAGRGRFRLCRSRVRGRTHIDPSSCRMLSSTPSRFRNTSSFVTRTTWKPSDSRMKVRCASRRSSASVEWVAPSTSTISFPSSVTKSTMKRSMGCCRRNFQRPSCLLRNSRQSISSALVSFLRRKRALALKYFISLTRPLARPTSPHQGQVSTGTALA